MTGEQLALALAMVDAESLPEAVSLAAANELRYLAAVNVDPIDTVELADLTRHIVTQAAAQAAAQARDAAAAAPPASNIDTGSPAVDNALYPTPAESAQMRNLGPLAVVDVVESVAVSAEPGESMRYSAFVLFDPAGFEPFRLTIQAAVEALNGLAAAIDELLTPGVGYSWEDVGVGNALLHHDPTEGAFAWSFIVTPAEVHRDDSGAYVVSTRFGRENPDPVVIASVRDMETAKYIAAQAVREFNAANGSAAAPPSSSSESAPAESV